MQFRDKCLQLINQIYTESLERITINGVDSDSFVINRVTKQGCPLLSLLNAVAIEVLAIN